MNHTTNLRRVTRALSAASAVALAAVPAACRSYERSPLTLDVHALSLEVREASSPEVAEFARSLAAAPVAGPFDASDGLSCREAELVALVYNASLREARLEAGVLAAGLPHAGKWDDPALELELSKILDASPWEAMGGFSLTLPVSGRLAFERERLGAKHAASLARLAAAEWSVRMEVRRALAEVAAADARVVASRAFVARVDEVSRIVALMEEKGELARTEARLFAIERGLALAELAELEADAEHARMAVGRLLGLLKVPALDAAGFGSLASSAAPETNDPSRSPAVAVAVSDYEVAERALALEMRRQYPDLVLGPSYGEEDGDRQFRLGLSLPIPVFNANARAIAEAEAARELARARAESAVERFMHDAREFAAHVHHAAERRERFERDIVPLVDAQDADIRRIVALGGEVPALVVLESIKRQHDAKLELIASRREEAAARIALDELVGEPPAAPTDTPNAIPPVADPREAKP
ncbi:MAG: TolC family protein [Planctomycetaceae bacterium]|nr:TolC family protein [Planctomycetaceae bacterium]